MNKILAGIVIVTLAIGGVYVAYQHRAGNAQILAYVPADTPYFFGTASPLPLTQWSRFLNIQQQQWAGTDWKTVLKEANIGDASDAGKMLSALALQYIPMTNSVETLQAELGIATDFEMVLYGDGLIPVLRFKLSQAAAFWQFIDKAETKAAVAVDTEAMQSATLRRYSLYAGSTQQADSSQLVIAEAQGYAVITMVTPMDQDAGLKRALGLDLPSESLAGSIEVDSLISQHQFLPQMVGYFSHKQLVLGLTDAAANQLGQQLTYLSEQPQLAQDFEWLAQARTPACQKDLQSVTVDWPRTVFGYTLMSLEKSPAELAYEMVIESTHKPHMKSLEPVVGHIPGHLQSPSSKPLLGLALGIDVDALVPYFNRTWKALAQAEYECRPLLELQQKLAQANPSAISMMSGMVAGAKGVSVTLFDFVPGVSTTPGMPGIEQADVMISLSAANPQSLLLLAASMAPPPWNQIEPKPGGSPVNVPLPFPIAGHANAQLVLNDRHAIIYLGERSSQQAQSLLNEEINQYGLLQVAMDYGRYTGTLAQLMPAATGGAPQPYVPTEVELFMSGGIKVAGDGIVFDSLLQVPSD